MKIDLCVVCFWITIQATLEPISVSTVQTTGTERKEKARGEITRFVRFHEMYAATKNTGCQRSNLKEYTQTGELVLPKGPRALENNYHHCQTPKGHEHDAARARLAGTNNERHR